MHSFTANVQNELEKWWLHRKTKWFLMFIVLIPVAVALLLDNVQTSIGIAAIIGTDFPLIMLQFTTVVLLPVYLFMAAADSFSAEAASRTLKIVLLRPISRAKVFASKLSALAVIAVIILAGGWLVSVLAGLLLPGSGIGGGFLDGMLAYTAAFIPMLILCIFAALIAQFFNSSTTTIVVCIALYAAAKLLPLFLPQAAVWSPFAYSDWQGMWIGGDVSPGRLLNVFVFLVAYSIIGYTAGLYRFTNRTF